MGPEAATIVADVVKLAFLEVRENTRRNASTLSHPVPQNRPFLPMHASHDRKVTFASTAPSTQSTLRGTIELKKEAVGESIEYKSISVY